MIASVRRGFLVFSFFLLLAAVETFPLILRLGTHVSDAGDPLMLTWVLAWDIHALTRGDLLHFFDANIFYPVERTLAFSEHMLGVVPIFAPGYLLTGNPVVGYNIVLLLSFALSGLGMFCLAYHWTRQFWPSLVAGTLFGFAPYRFGQVSHLQLQTFFWAPFALLFLDRFLRTRRWLHLVGFAGFYWLQVLSSVYLGYMVTVGVVLYVAFHVLVVDRSLLRLSLLPKALAFVGSSVAVLLPVHLPYLKVQESWGFVRNIPEIMYFTPDILSYLSAPPFMNDLYLYVFRRIEPAAVWEKWLFPGLLLPALAILGSRRRSDSRSVASQRRLRHVLWLILAGAVVVSLGPYLILFGVQTRVPLPYLILHSVIPGFTGMRVPGRFVLLALLAASPLAALGAIRCSAVVSRLLKPRTRFAHALTAAGLIGLFLLELGWKPFTLVPVPDSEQVGDLYRWLNTERPGPIVELPFGFFEEYRYVYFATAHWLPLVNGLSSFAPSTYDEIHSALRELPTRKAVEYAGVLGVKAIVVHSTNLSQEDLSRWTDEAAANSGLKRIAAFGPHVVYSVPHVAVSPSLSLDTTAPPWVPLRNRVRLGLVLRPEGNRPWRHPGPHGSSKGVVQWTDSRGRVLTAPARLQLPLVIPAGATVAVPVEGSFPVPDAPGVYAFQAFIPVLGVTSAARVVEVRNTILPTSIDAPRLLATIYSSPAVDAPIVVRDDEPVRVDIGATNIGEALWLARAHLDRGVVKLGWQWTKNGHKLAEGRAPIRYDVFPGQSYRFQLTVNPPDVPGSYLLEIGLVSEFVAWFADRGVQPLKLTVKVRPASDVLFADLLQRRRSLEADAPSLALSTVSFRHRAGEVLQLKVSASNEKRPWFVDAYLILEGPEGALWFHDGQRLVLYRKGQWPRLASNVQLRTGTRSSVARSLPLTGIMAGTYTWYLLLTDAGSERVIADSRTSFEIAW